MNGEYIQTGKNWDYENPTGELINAGTLVLIGDVCGIAATDIEPHAVGSVATTGVWAFPKAAEEVTAGKKVYYDDAADKATVTEKTNVLGVAVAAAKSEDATVMVRLNG